MNSFDSMNNFSLFWHRPSSFFLSLPLILEIVVVHVGFSHRYSRAESIVQKNQNMNAPWLGRYIEENYGSFSYILTCTRSQMELIPGCIKATGNPVSCMQWPLHWPSWGVLMLDDADCVLRQSFVQSQNKERYQFVSLCFVSHTNFFWATHNNHNSATTKRME